METAMSRKELSGEGAASLISSVAFREEQFEDYLPFVSLVDDETILTRGGEYMQCIRVNGLNSMTANDEALIRLKNGSPPSLRKPKVALASISTRSASGFRRKYHLFAVMGSPPKSIGVGSRLFRPTAFATRH